MNSAKDFLHPVRLAYDVFQPVFAFKLLPEIFLFLKKRSLSFSISM